jgi:large subunit ribosomal protein L29
MNKQAEKFRNLGAAELSQTLREHMDQLFRLKFQMKMGQTESLNKIRTLRRNVARLKTINRQHQLGIVPNVGATQAEPKAKAEAKPKAAAAPKGPKPAPARGPKPAKTSVKKAGKK